MPAFADMTTSSLRLKARYFIFPNET
jgi:hypothetical protein